MKKVHSFHIPVMGTGFSIDTPIKVAKYGISSVISLVDDVLIEMVRKFYCEKLGEPYVAITKDEHDFRAKRITAYLNLVDTIVNKQFTELQSSAFEVGSEITKYFEMLSDKSPLKKVYHTMLDSKDMTEKQKLQKQLRESISPGDINVNIMTKLDRPNYAKTGEELSSEYSDALAALRGYAKSTVSSAIVFSAGINRRLYSYAENFKDFYADATGFIKKKIILKVSDYRSSVIQGKFFAKKGLWISEHRIESGLNCGGHVFPAAGELLGPILEEFKNKKEELILALHDIYNQALKLKEKFIFTKPHKVLITAQGGIGTNSENEYLMNQYQIDGTGWATPFLLVPEVTNVDEPTLKELSQASEDDLYTSDVSPLGVPFNNLKGSMSDHERDVKIAKGRPGSACPKSFLVSDTEFTDKPICKASRQYQKLKIDQLDQMNVEPAQYKQMYKRIVEKACICTDLGDGIILKNNIFDRRKALFPAVCPGPNMAYFTKISTLKEMIGHIYGRLNLLNGTPRPHIFIKEIKVNIDFFKKEIQKALPGPSEKQIKYLNEFRKNLLKGIDYYRNLYPQMIEESKDIRQRALADLEAFQERIDDLIKEYQAIFPQPLPQFAVV